MVEKMNLDIQKLSTADIMSVYSGKAGRCCCGCAGKHTYNPLHRASAGKQRGYPVDDSEFNAGMITKVLRLIQAEEPFGTVDVASDHIALKLGMKLYIAYFARFTVES